MGIEIDLLKNYPKTVRDVKARGVEKTEEDRSIARKFLKQQLVIKTPIVKKPKRLNTLFNKINYGDIKEQITNIFDLKDASIAHTELQSRSTTGSIIFKT